MSVSVANTQERRVMSVRTEKSDAKAVLVVKREVL